MNRRKFFAGIAATVTAACVPDLRDKAVSLRNVKIQFPNLKDYAFQGSVTGRWKGPGHMLRYGSGLREFKLYAHQIQAMQDFSELEKRTLTYLNDRSKRS